VAGRYYDLTPARSLKFRPMAAPSAPGSGPYGAVVRQPVLSSTVMRGGPSGVDRILDSTGGSILDRSFEAIRALGHVVSYGEAEGRPFPNLWGRLVRKSLTFTRLHIGHIDARSPAWLRGMKEVSAGTLAGSIAVPIEGVHPPAEARQAFRRLQSRQVAGKLLLEITP
jgi:NADPH:quinone reductase